MKKTQFHKKHFLKNLIFMMLIAFSVAIFSSLADGQTTTPLDVTLGAGDRIAIRVSVE